MANAMQTNKIDAQCDKLATELSWQRFASKVVNFQLPRLHLTYSTCIWRLCWGDPIWVYRDFQHQETTALAGVALVKTSSVTKPTKFDISNSTNTSSRASVSDWSLWVRSICSSYLQDTRL